MWLLLACAAPPAGRPPPEADGAPGDTAAPEPPAAVPAPSPWSWTRDDPAGSALDAAALAGAIQAAVDVVVDVDPLEFFGAYSPHLGYGTATCPSFDPGWAPQVYWEGDCTGENGASFHGWAVSHQAHGVVDEAGRWCEDNAFFFGFARIAAPDGTPFEAWGEVGYDDCVDGDGVRRLDASVEGDFYWPVVDDWISRRVPVQLTWTLAADASVWTLDLAGAVSAEVDPAATVDFAMRFPDGTGTVTLWDAEGRRAEVVFDGGCGMADAGEVCVDWALLVDWEARPWS